MDFSHDEDNTEPETEEYQQALEFLKRPEFEFKAGSGRLPLRRIWIPIYLVTVVILFFIYFMLLTSSFPIPLQRIINISALAIFSAVIVAPLLATLAVPIMRYVHGEMIEQSNFKDRIAHDLANARGLREKLNSDKKLKILGAHVKRDADKTSDRSNFLSQVLLLSGIFLAGVMLAVNDPDRTETVTAITTVAAFFTFLARGLAVMRLSTLRDWLSVIEQAQNVAGEEQSPQAGEKSGPAKPEQVSLLEEKPTLGIKDIHSTPERERIKKEPSH